MGEHDHHRQRVFNRVLTDGLENFEEHNALELLLFFAYRRGDTNELAHRLIREFGSFSRVLDASGEDLTVFRWTVSRWPPTFSVRNFLLKQQKSFELQSWMIAACYCEAAFCLKVLLRLRPSISHASYPKH